LLLFLFRGPSRSLSITHRHVKITLFGLVCGGLHLQHCLGIQTSD
jgi:hypothetical protein